MTPENLKILEDRVSELEVKISFQNSTIEELNSVVTNQQNQIDLLNAKLEKLTQKIDDPVQIDPTQNKPPHY